MPGTPSPDHSANPLFQSFSWHRPDVPPSYQKMLAEYAHDIGNGITMLLALIEFHESQELDDTPLLTAVDKGTLLRLAIASSKLLAHFAYAQISKANRAQRKASSADSSEGEHGA